MQIKPFFKEYKEISRIPLIKDDRGVSYSLVHFEGIVEDENSSKTFHPEHCQYTNPETGERYYNTFQLPTGYTITKKYEGYVVMSDEITKHANGATSYCETLFWKQPKKLEKIKVGEFLLVEHFVGQNSYFTGELPTMNTQFVVLVLPEKSTTN